MAYIQSWEQMTLFSLQFCTSLRGKKCCLSQHVHQACSSALLRPVMPVAELIRPLQAQDLCFGSCKFGRSLQSTSSRTLCCSCPLRAWFENWGYKTDLSRLKVSICLFFFFHLLLRPLSTRNQKAIHKNLSTYVPGKIKAICWFPLKTPEWVFRF